MRPHRLVFLTLILALGAMAAGSLSGSAQTASPTKLRFVSTPWPPFTGEQGQPRFALDLVEEGLGRIGVHSTTTIVEPPRFTVALLSSDFDGSAAAWKDPDRELLLLYSEPYLENRLILLGRKGADVSATSLGALRGKKVAVVEGYAYGDIENSGPLFVRSRSEEDSLSRLLANSVDYVLMDELVVQYLVNNYSKQAKTKLEFGTTPLITRKMHLAVRRALPDAESIITRFNGKLRGMIADRTYHRLLHVSWIVADVDGDGVPEYVPQADQAGTTPPKSAYALFTDVPQEPQPEVLPKGSDVHKPGFYVGGTTYPDWARVPDKYKIPEPTTKPQDPARSTASLFKFVW